MAQFKFVVVMGASAGGLKVVAAVAEKLNKNLDAAFMVVLHMPKTASAEIIKNHIQKNTTLVCEVAQNDIEPKRGHLYLAPPGKHLFVSTDKILLTDGPPENNWKPSIDVLFRSAAAAYNTRTIGIVLSGLLDDGTAGMTAIKRSGGKCIVQEPQEAEFGDMPQNVLRNVEVDFNVPAPDIAYILQDLLSKPVPEPGQAPPEVMLEAQITGRMGSDIDNLPELGIHSNFTCPDCGGNLWQVKNDTVKRFRCHTGHVYNERLLVEKQEEAIEESLWVAIWMMEERKNLLLHLGEQARHKKEAAEAIEKEQQARGFSQHITRLKAMLANIITEQVPEKK